MKFPTPSQNPQFFWINIPHNHSRPKEQLTKKLKQDTKLNSAVTEEDLMTSISTAEEEGIALFVSKTGFGVFCTNYALSIQM